MHQVSGDVRRHGSILPNNPPWDTLSDHSVAQLLDAATPISLRRGDPVKCNVGILCSGALAVERRLYDGRRILCTLFHGGDLVDLTRSERMNQGQLTALNPSLFLSLENSRVEAYFGRHSELAEAMLSRFRQHFERMRDHVTDLVHKTPVERLASLLFEFRRWPENNMSGAGKNVVRIPIQRSDIADYIGVKPETLSRTTTKLAKEGLIDTSGPDEIHLIDIPAMRRIADGGRPRQSTRAGR